MASSKRCKPCSCGSGKKFGDCCGRPRQDVHDDSELPVSNFSPFDASLIKNRYVDLRIQNPNAAMIQISCALLR